MRFFLLLFFPVLLFTACQREEGGCTDITAINYNANAIVDDGTCKYCQPKQSVIFGFVLRSENPNDLELEVEIESPPVLSSGCSLTIDLSNFSLPLDDTQIEWGPAEIFDCASCTIVTLTPLETTDISLKIDNTEGYYFKGSFEIAVL